jgi:hypothetical protein
LQIGAFGTIAFPFSHMRVEESAVLSVMTGVDCRPVP